MKTMCNHKEHSGNGGFASGALLGALIGFAAGVLLAPEAGKETRKKLQTVKEDYSDKANQALEQIQQLFGDDVSASKEVTLPGKKKKLFKSTKKS